VTERETLDLYEATGALLRGHFLLTSGLHSDVYLQSALVLQHPADATKLGEALAAPFRGDRIQTVLAPAIGGILVSHEVARALGVRALFTEREGGTMRLRRGFALAPAERCLVVEDVMTTGGSTRETIHVARAAGAQVVGAAAIVDRGVAARSGRSDLGVPFTALLHIDLPTYEREECPLCAQGLPAVKPGSRT